MAGFWKAETGKSNPTWLDQMTLRKSFDSLILYLAQKTKLFEKLELLLNQTFNEMFWHIESWEFIHILYKYWT